MLKRQTLLACILAAAAWAAPALAQDAPRAAAQLLTDQEQEAFLKQARIVHAKAIGVGVTDSQRATLSDGTVTHDAHVQTIDMRKREFASPQGVELDFVDSWTYNIAAYRLDRMLGLNLVPVSVERRWRSNAGAFTWWVDDVLMDEAARYKNSTTPPDVPRWSEQMQLIRLFDELIYNVDRNLGNLLITRSWRVWAIDHTRAFRMARTLRKPENITRCDRQVLERLKALDRASLDRELGKVLDRGRISALLARRDAIVSRLESLGPGVIFDRAGASR